MSYPGSFLRMSITPQPFQCCAACSSSVQTPTIWIKLTDPKGVSTEISWGSSAINICCIRDSLLSNALCQDTWSPTHNVLPVKYKFKYSDFHFWSNGKYYTSLPISGKNIYSDKMNQNLEMNALEDKRNWF